MRKTAQNNLKAEIQGRVQHPLAGGVFCLCAELEPDESGALCPPEVLADAARALAGLAAHPAHRGPMLMVRTVRRAQAPCDPELNDYTTVSTVGFQPFESRK